MATPRPLWGMRKHVPRKPENITIRPQNAAEITTKCWPEVFLNILGPIPALNFGRHYNNQRCHSSYSPAAIARRNMQTHQNLFIDRFGFCARCRVRCLCHRRIFASLECACMIHPRPFMLFAGITLILTSRYACCACPFIIQQTNSFYPIISCSPETSLALSKSRGRSSACTPAKIPLTRIQVSCLSFEAAIQQACRSPHMRPASSNTCQVGRFLQPPLHNPASGLCARTLPSTEFILTVLCMRAICKAAAAAAPSPSRRTEQF